MIKIFFLIPIILLLAVLLGLAVYNLNSTKFEEVADNSYDIFVVTENLNAFEDYSPSPVYDNSSLGKEISYVYEEEYVSTYSWGSLEPEIVSEFIFLTNGDFSIGNHLVSKGEEFLGFTLEKIYRSVIEVWDDQPFMNHTVHAVLTNGTTIVTGDVYILLSYDYNDPLWNSFIFSAHEYYFDTLPAVVGDMTSEDISFNIDNYKYIIDFFELNLLDKSYLRTMPLVHYPKSVMNL